MRPKLFPAFSRRLRGSVTNRMGAVSIEARAVHGLDTKIAHWPGLRAATLAGMLACAGALLSACGGASNQAASTTPASPAQPASATLPVANRTLLIDLDGATYAAVQAGIAAGTLPNLARLQIQLAYSGGVAGTTSQQQNLDTPSWASLLTGTWAESNGVYSDAPNQALHNNSVFAMAKTVIPSPTGAAVESTGLYQLLTPEQNAGYLDTLTNCSQQAEDTCVTNAALQMIDSGDSVVVAQYHSAEDAAENDGLSSSNYSSTLTQLDQAVGTLVAETVKYPNWLVVVSAGHGLNPAGLADGLPQLSESTTFVGLSQTANTGSQGVNATVPSALSGLYAYANITDVTPTLLSWLSALPTPANYAMDGGELLGPLPVSQLTGVTGSDNQSIVLTWVAPATGAITVLRNAQVIANLPAGTTTFTDNQLGLTAADTYTFDYTVAAGTASASDLVTITYVPPPPPPPPLASTLTQGLTTYYPSSSYSSTLPTFAAPALDALVTGGTPDSTLGLWAGDYQSGSLTPDPFGGQGLLIDTSIFDPNGFDGYMLKQVNDVTAQPAFTIGFWFKTPGAASQDTPIFTNKSYLSGANPGVAIGLFPSGLAFNIGDGANRADAPTNPFTPYTRNQWIYISLSVDTVAQTMSWHVFDPVLGEETGSVSTGAVDLTALPGLGQFGVNEDATGTFAFTSCGDTVPYTGQCPNGAAQVGIQESFSDIALWNRVLTEGELQSIYASKMPLSTLLPTVP
jgi:hypothetical protein